MKNPTIEKAADVLSERVFDIKKILKRGPAEILGLDSKNKLDFEILKSEVEADFIRLYEDAENEAQMARILVFWLEKVRKKREFSFIWNRMKSCCEMYLPNVIFSLSGFIEKREDIVVDIVNAKIISLLLDDKYQVEEVGKILDSTHKKAVEVLRGHGYLAGKNESGDVLALREDIADLLGRDKYLFKNIYNIVKNVDRIISSVLSSSGRMPAVTPQEIEHVRKKLPLKTPSLDPNNEFHNEILECNENPISLSVLSNKYLTSSKLDLVLLFWIKVANEEEDFEFLYSFCKDRMMPNLLRRMFEFYALDMLK